MQKQNSVNKLVGKSRKNIAVIICCVLIVLCFTYTVLIRRAWFARPLSIHNEEGTAHSVCVTRNWLKDGIFNSRFMHVLNPASIEFEDLLHRWPYTSYPPGAFIIVFVLAKVFNIKDLVALYQAYNLFNHLIISLFLFFIMFQINVFFKKTGIFKIIFSIIPSIIYLYTPSTLYWHQNVFFVDQAVIMLFIMFIYLEIKYLLKRQLTKWNKIFFAFIIFLGTLTDWLFVFVVFAASVLRILFIQGEKRSLRQCLIINLDLVIPTLLALALFIYQIMSVGLMRGLIERFEFRASRDGLDAFLAQHFGQFNIWGYGIVLCLAGIFSVVAFFFYYAFLKLKAQRDNSMNKVSDVYLYLIALSTLPCLLQVFTFQQHSMFHDFSTLKWAVPLSLIPFGIVPSILIDATEKFKSRKILNRFICILYLILFSYGVLYKTTVSYKNFFMVGSDDNKRIGELVKRNSSYNDICFSFDFEIPVFPPLKLAYSEKRVYLIKKFQKAEKIVSNLAHKGAVGKIFIAEKDWHSLEEKAGRKCSEVYKDTDYYVCKIVKSE